ncbi:hypothetical protein GCM10008927_18400 [Amylibacter ulvae]|uniref:Uncharacterized protein n=1 Tax=Paramylibacter ulvae TaxID=1651968 RepID=A0ABQ3D1C6_9RHOB|nr:hypothetical protein GCM10008927_18400 [Amylibacter ulvae]
MPTLISAIADVAATDVSADASSNFFIILSPKVLTREDASGFTITTRVRAVILTKG